MSNLNERWASDKIKVMPCLFCRHYEGGGICPAFPQGIPRSIRSGDNNHLSPLPGQGNKIVFEKNK